MKGCINGQECKVDEGLQLRLTRTVSVGMCLCEYGRGSEEVNVVVWRWSCVRAGWCVCVNVDL